MQPLILTMNAFGPYAKKEVVNFEEYAPQGLLLISGDTGTGKTIIFDAISFALFGKVSGDIRDKNTLRSDFADGGDTCFVEFEFLHKEQRYIVSRRPTQNFVKKDGTIGTRQAEAELIYPDKKAVTGIHAVDEAIKELLCIDHSQFVQISMIAQGQFQNLIHAKSADREKIFREIFSTQIFEAFQNEIHKRTQAAYLNREGLTQSLEYIFTNIDVPNKDDFLKQHDHLLENTLHTQKEEVKAFFKSILAFDSDTLRSLEKQRENLKHRYEKSDFEFKQAQNVNSILEDYRISSKNLLELQVNVTDAEKNAKHADEQRKLHEEKLREQIDANTRKLDELKQLAQVKQEFEHVSKKENDAKVAQQNTREAIAANIEEIDTLEARVKELDDIPNKLQNAEYEIKDCRNRYRELQDKRDKSKELAHLDKKIIEQTNNYKNYREQTEQRVCAAQELLQAYLDEQAGFLAQNLHEGEPCPVCGSTKHPKLALIQREDISKENVDKAQSEAKKAQENLEKQSQALASQKSLREEKFNQMHAFFKESFNREVEVFEMTKLLEDQLKKEKEKGLKLKTRVQDLTKLQNEQKEKLEEIEIKKKRESALQSNLEKQNQEHTNQFAKLTSVKDTLKNLQDALGDLTEEAVECAITEDKTKLNKLIGDARTTREQLSEAKQKLAGVKERINTLEDQLRNLRISKDQELFDLHELEKKRSEADRAYNDAIQMHTSVLQRYKLNEQKFEEWNDKLSEFEQGDEELTLLDRIDKTANGNLGAGSLKINFESYVLGFYFDHILYQANKRLSKLTNQRYELLRSKESQGNKRVGLDIDVYDRYTAQVRPATTLSGGETFKASLSLALGLSDYISQISGAVELDATFIDEGFGTLDSESLDAAVDILAELAKDKRFVGIISHVEEFRDRIEKQILVKRKKDGSSYIEYV